ncbi:class I SAM-dependent DNA methyltransferase [Streptomyces sp. NPDC056132]|uniref:class I SAM-dependent DNA methyltransferase n=1 Tax=Streptomyces sp. NPDC056132 TaxID=3345722 RepID=UPI0035D7624B
MSTPSSYFEGMYRESADPWHLAERWYERRKYDLTVASLPRRRYRRALEPACSVGELTLRLAERCDEVLACDRVESAVATAVARTSHLPQVTVRQLTLPQEWPPGTFDLIVLSEVLYYFDRDTLDDILRRTASALEPGGTLVTVHWNHPVAEHLWTGDELAGVLASVPGLALLADHREDDFVLQTFGRANPDGCPPASPAADEGLV